MITAPAAMIIDPKPPSAMPEPGPVSDPAFLLAALSDIARLRAALRELTAMILRHPPTGSVVAELVAAMRAAQDLDWANLQQELAEAADQLAAHASRSKPEEAAHGS